MLKKIVYLNGINLIKSEIVHLQHDLYNRVDLVIVKGINALYVTLAIINNSFYLENRYMIIILEI